MDDLSGRKEANEKAPPVGSIYSFPAQPIRFEDGIPTNLWAGLVIPELIPLGREDNYAGSLLKSEIPFPKLEGMTTQQQTDAMFRYITQKDVLSYLDWNLYIRGAQSHIEGIGNELKAGHFSYVGTKEDHEHELRIWRFVQEHLDDPRLAWLKKVDEFRQQEENKPKPEIEKVLPTKASSVESVSPQPPKPPERTLEQQVFEDHVVPKWILMNLQRSPPESLVEYLKKEAVKDSKYQSSVVVVQHILDHLDEYPTAKKEIEDRKKGTTEWIR